MFNLRPHMKRWCNRCWHPGESLLIHSLKRQSLCRPNNSCLAKLFCVINLKMDQNKLQYIDGPSDTPFYKWWGPAPPIILFTPTFIQGMREWYRSGETQLPGDPLHGRKFTANNAMTPSQKIMQRNSETWRKLTNTPSRPFITCTNGEAIQGIQGYFKWLSVSIVNYGVNDERKTVCPKLLLWISRNSRAARTLRNA